MEMEELIKIDRIIQVKLHLQEVHLQINLTVNKTFKHILTNSSIQLIRKQLFEHDYSIRSSE
jgi:hypothetical protein